MFYQLIRIILISGTMNHSVQYFYLDDYDSVDALLVAVQARYHNVLATDLGNENCTYNACYVISNDGNFVKGMHEVFDRREDEDEEETES